MEPGDIDDPQEAGRLLEDAEYRIVCAADAIKDRAQELDWTSRMLDLICRCALKDPLYIPVEWLDGLERQVRRQGDARLIKRTTELRSLVSNVSALRDGYSKSSDRVRRNAELGTMLERRRAERVPFELDVAWVRDGERVNGRCRNISQGGMMIEISPRPQVGQAFELALRLPAWTSEDCLRLETRWASDGDADSPAVIGAQFVELDEAQQRDFAELVAERSGEAGGLAG